MSLVDVAAMGELDEGVPTRVTANGRKIVLVRWEERVYAVRDICPHQAASFGTAQVRPKIVADRPGSGARLPEWDLSIEDAGPVIQCPWHKWEFRLRTGLCATDERFRVRLYSAQVDGDRVLVDTSNTSRGD